MKSPRHVTTNVKVRLVVVSIANLRDPELKHALQSETGRLARGFRSAELRSVHPSRSDPGRLCAHTLRGDRLPVKVLRGIGCSRTLSLKSCVAS